MGRSEAQTSGVRPPIAPNDPDASSWEDVRLAHAAGSLSGRTIKRSRNNLEIGSA